MARRAGPTPFTEGEHLMRPAQALKLSVHSLYKKLR